MGRMLILCVWFCLWLCRAVPCRAAPRRAVLCYAVQALWGRSGAGMQSDLVSAIEDAIKDGVDVINLSATTATDTFRESTVMAFMNAGDTLAVTLQVTLDGNVTLDARLLRATGTLREASVIHGLRECR